MELTNTVTQGRSLFVCSLPSSATTETLTQFFSKSYPIRHATVVSDPVTKESKGYGFVTLTDSTDANQAIETINGTEFEGRRIKVEHAERRLRGTNRDKRIDPKGLASKVGGSNSPRVLGQQPSKLIIRNLPWAVSKPEQLAALFRPFGKVKHTTIPEKRPGVMAGFGFIVIRGHKNADKALKTMNGKEIEGRTLAVDWAIDKEAWEASQMVSREELPQQAAPFSLEIYQETKTSDPGSDLEKVEDPVSTDQQTTEVLTQPVSINEEMQRLDHVHKDTTMLEDHSDNSSSLFVRNIPYNITDESLMHHFSFFGPVRYARIVMHPSTGTSKGTGFVCFWRKEDAVSCLREAPNPKGLSSASTNQSKSSNLGDMKSNSVLENIQADATGRYTLEGRVLHIVRAVDKSEAQRLELTGRHARDMLDKDKRRLFLLNEGIVSSNSLLHANLSPSEIKLREDNLKRRKDLIKNNPSLYLSLTRLSIRNLPPHVTSKELKALARQAVVDFSRDVKAGSRLPLSKEEVMRGGLDMREAERSRRRKGKGIVRQVKIVFENKEGARIPETIGASHSRGYGFIEYTSHRWALMGLRFLNGYAMGPLRSQSKEDEPLTQSKEKKRRRLVVEFAIENVQVTKRRREKETRSQGQSSKTAEDQNSSKTPSSPARQSFIPSISRSKSKRKRDTFEGRQEVASPSHDLSSPSDSSAKDRYQKKRTLLGRERGMRGAGKVG